MIEQNFNCNMTITYLVKEKEEKKDILQEKKKGKKRTPTKELDLVAKDIMAASSALGGGDNAFLYVDGFPDPLETTLSFKELKEKILSEKGPHFVEAGTKYLINIDCIKQVEKSPSKSAEGKKGKGTIIFNNGMQVEDINLQDIKSLYQNIRFFLQANEEQTKQLSKVVLAKFKNLQNQQIANVSNTFKPLEDSMNANGCLLAINSLLLIIVAILSIILIFKL